MTWNFAEGIPKFILSDALLEKEKKKQDDVSINPLEPSLPKQHKTLTVTVKDSFLNLFNFKLRAHNWDFTV